MSEKIERVNLIKEYAIGAVFSDTAEKSYTALVEELEQGNIPEEVLVWQPFETLDPQALLEQVEEQYNIFEHFAERLINESK